MSDPAHMTSPDELQAWQAAIGDVVRPGQVLGGKYRLDGLLGAGGMGVVLRAWHLHFEERVAVKLMLSQIGSSTTARARFEREARAAFKIKSEHAARAIDIGFLDTGQPFIVMEFLDGQDLGKLLEQRGQLPVIEAVDFVLQACEAVAEAHVRRIVHRDLKPDNLFLTTGTDGGPCIKVVDFGISKEGTEPDAPAGPSKASLLTAAGTTLGTPAYMAPEQWGAAQTVGPAADIWALGVILHQLVTGQLPFDAESLRELFAAVMTAPARPLRSFRPELPVALEQTVLRCLEKDPAARFASVGELALAIGPLGSHLAAASVAWIGRVQQAAGMRDSLGADGTGPGINFPGVVTPAPFEGPLAQGTSVSAPLGFGPPGVAAGPPTLQTTPQPWHGAPAAQRSGSSSRAVVIAGAAAVAFVLGVGGWLAMQRVAGDGAPEGAGASAAPTDSVPAGGEVSASGAAAETPALDAGASSATDGPADATAGAPSSTTERGGTADRPAPATTGARAEPGKPPTAATSPAKATSPGPSAKSPGKGTPDPFRTM